MAMAAFIKRLSKQTVVYWGSPRNDGFNKFEFDPPVELKVVWQKSKDIATTPAGEEILSTASVWYAGDLDMNALLILGDMKSSIFDNDPYKIDTQYLYRILSVEEIPDMDNPNDSVKRYYLNVGRYRGA